MPAKKDYAIEDQILAAKTVIDAILQEVRTTGATIRRAQEFSEDREGAIVKTISDLFIPIAKLVDQENPTAKHLFNLSFGKGSRFDRWRCLSTKMSPQL